jgi:hypothetical protein
MKIFQRKRLLKMNEKILKKKMLNNSSAFRTARSKILKIQRMFPLCEERGTTQVVERL